MLHKICKNQKLSNSPKVQSVTVTIYNDVDRPEKKVKVYMKNNTKRLALYFYNEPINHKINESSTLNGAETCIHRKTVAH